MSRQETGSGLQSVKKLRERLSPLRAKLSIPRPGPEMGHRRTNTDTSTRSSTSSVHTPTTPTPCSPVAEYNLKTRRPNLGGIPGDESIEIVARRDVTTGVTLITAPELVLVDLPAAVGKQDGDAATEKKRPVSLKNQTNLKRDVGGESIEVLAQNDVDGVAVIPSAPTGQRDDSLETKRKQQPSVPKNSAATQKFAKSFWKQQEEDEQKQQSQQQLKTCFLTGQTIPEFTPHYRAQRISGSFDSPPVYTLASSMKLIGCPTICDDDLRRMDKLCFVRNNRRLPEELRLSSNWTRVSKFCSFSGRPIEDGTPFYYARKKKVDDQGTTKLGGYYYLRADIILGEDRDGDGVTNANRPLTRDDLILLIADYPEKCDAIPSDLLQEPSEWTLVSKFCFFSGGPIKSDDTYYKTELNGEEIYLLVVLSPAISPRELFRLDTIKLGRKGNKTIKELRAALIPMTVEEVENVEKVYDLSTADFHSLRKKHLGKYIKLPTELTDPDAWHRAIPASFFEAKEKALQKARDIEKSAHTSPPFTEQQLSLSVPAAETSSLLIKSASTMIERAKLEVLSLQCGSPESFSLKELMQDDSSFLRELAENGSIFDEEEEDESSIESIEKAKATLRRYADRTGVAVSELFDGDHRLSMISVEMFDELSSIGLVDTMNLDGELTLNS